jgi:putative heme-binding domain-containing protein
MVLLDQPPHNSLPASAVLPRLFDGDPGIQATARFILQRHPEWVPQSVPTVRAILSRPSTVQLESLRELLLVFHSHPEISRLVAEAVSTEATQSNEPLQLLLIGFMRQAKVEKFPDEWVNALRSAFQDGSEAIQTEVIRTTRFLRLHTLDDLLAGFVRDAQKPDELRAQAVQTLLRNNGSLGELEFALLLKQLDRSRAPLARLTAMETMGRATLRSEQINRLVGRIADDPFIAPGSILSLAERSHVTGDSGEALISYIERAIHAGWSIAPQSLAWLSSIAPRDAKERVEILKRELTTKDNDQVARLSRIEKLLPGGVVDRGRALFFGAAGCSACHRVGSEGGLIGPDLTTVGAVRSVRDLVESVVYPSATFAQGYEPYRVSLKNGDELTGIRTRQVDESFVLRDASGAEYHLNDKEIEKIERTKLSLMPEGLLSGLSEESMRDLFAFLQNLK